MDNKKMKNNPYQIYLKKQLVRFIKDFGLRFDASEFGSICDLCGETMAVHTYGYSVISSFRYDYMKPYLSILFDLYMGDTSKSKLFKSLHCDKDSFLIDKFIEIRNISELTEFVALKEASSSYINTGESYITNKLFEPWTTNVIYAPFVLNDCISQINYQTLQV